MNGTGGRWAPLRPLVVVVVCALLGLVAGLGSAAVLGGLVAMFLLVAVNGGSLAADLRLMTWFGPVIVVEVGVLRLLGDPAPYAADALVVVLVFVAGLVPVLGPRYVTVGLGLGMSAVFAHGLTTIGVLTPVQSFGAPLLAVAVVVGMRVLSGRADPDLPVRQALAAALTDPAPAAQEGAARLTRDDGPRRWTGAALAGIVRYRTSWTVLTSRRALLTGPAGAEIDRQLGGAAEAAEALADRIRDRHAATPGRSAPSRPAGRPTPLPGATGALVVSLWQGLDLAATANTDRDRARTPAPPGGHGFPAVLRGAFEPGSIQTRHALRCALGMAVALGVARLVGPSPFVVAFLITTFTVMQPQLMDTVTKVRQRAVGALAGAAALGLVAWLFEAPQPVLVGLALVALLVGFYFMQSRPELGNAAMVFLSVALNGTLRHLDLRVALLQYLGLIAAAIAIALVFGFLVVPGVRRPDPPARLAEAVRTERELLGEVAAALRERPRGGPSGPWPDRARLAPVFRAAGRARSDLTATQPGRPGSDDRLRPPTEWAAEGLTGLTGTSAALLGRPSSGVALAPALSEVARQLDTDVMPDPARVADLLPRGADAEQRLLVDSMTADLLAVRQAAARLTGSPGDTR